MASRARARGRHRLFLLSPANAGGERASLLLRAGATFPLARAVQSPAGAPLGEVFRFTSGLYFRGKVTYAAAFAQPPPGVPGSLVITPGAGLVAPETRVTASDLRSFAAIPIDPRDARYRAPLERDVRALAGAAPRAEVVLLGSIASGKYVDVLLAVLGDRLLFPEAFVGRGDMSRGGLMLRCVRAGEELAYVQVAGAVRHGPTPPRLPRLPR
ncbi:MAG TPA: hypothetical protein VF904_11345 [Anaeromyxobacteraceae bacterium]